MSISNNASAYASGGSMNLAGLLATKIQEKWMNKLDFDGSGGVGQTEFQAALQGIGEKLDIDLSQEGQAMFAGADLDGDGELRGTEINNLMSNMFGVESNTQSFLQSRGDCSCHEVSPFDRMDMNQDGFLSRGEFNAMQGMMGPMAGYGTLGMYGSPVYGAGYGPMPMPAPAYGAMAYGGSPYGGAMEHHGVSSVSHGAFNEATTTSAVASASDAASTTATQVADASDVVPATEQAADTTVASNDAAASDADPLAALVGGIDADGDGQVSGDELSQFVARMEGMVSDYNETQLASAAADKAFSENAA